MGKTWSIKKSSIHGKGVFTEKRFVKREKIDVGIEHFLYFFPSITNFGSMINHSWSPTAELSYSDKDNVYYVFALKDIDENVEVTLNYEDTPWFVDKPKEDYV